MIFSLFVLGSIAFAFNTTHVSLKEQHRQLEQRNQLLANVAHELKTPIATVGVALEALENFGADAHPQRRREYLELSRGELGRLDELADRALTGLRGGTLTDRINPQPLNLRTLTEEAWRALRLRYQLPPDRLTITHDEDEPPTLNGDRHYLYQVIHNLLDNAIKYGGNPPVITVSIEHDHGHSLDYTVRDNGPGIPHEERERIFERFYRSPTTERGHVVRGNGLGLALVRQIAEAHGGHTQAGTHPGGGGWVSMQLPRS